ncbi:MAG: alcohol dehydrogenase catalytic domain-containing protein [Acidimicrobiia bacterium]
MKAVVYTRPLELEFSENNDRPVAGEGEVVVDVKAVGICGSELEGFASQSPFRVPPLIMGHEFAGITAVGERVVVNPVISCGRCDMCVVGNSNICRERSIIGIHRPGAFAEAVSVPATSIFPIPHDMEFVTAALVEPMANAIHAVRLGLSAVHRPKRVGVIGAGALGLFTAIAARREGISEIALSDLAEVRRESARSAGFESVSSALDGEYDVIFDAVGSRTTRQSSVSLLRPRGVAVWIGLHGPDAGFDGLDLIRQEKGVLGTFVYDESDFRAAIGLVNEIDASLIATVPLEGGVDAFMGLLDGPVREIKTVLVP